MCMLSYSILIKDASKEYISDLAEEFSLLDLIGKQLLLVDDCGNKQEAMFPELLLAAAKECGPVFLEACYPLLAELSLHKLWGCQEKYVIVHWGGGLRQDHGCQR